MYLIRKHHFVVCALNIEHGFFVVLLMHITVHLFKYRNKKQKKNKKKTKEITPLA